MQSGVTENVRLLHQKPFDFVLVLLTVEMGMGQDFWQGFPGNRNCSTYLVTCCHVLKSMEIARNAKIYFNRVKDDGVRIPARDLLQFDNNLHQMNEVTSI